MPFREMSDRDIRTIIAAFGESARRVQEAGFDGVQIHGAHGYLVTQFLSPKSNRRGDRWGGSLENRMRFALEVARAIRTYQAGHGEDALKILVNAAIKEPDNAEIHTTAVKLLLREGRYSDIENYITHLPETVRGLDAIDSMRTHARLLRLAQEAPPKEQLDALLEGQPANHEAAMQRIAVAVTEDDYPTAFDGLMKLLKIAPPTERTFAHKVMRTMFSVLGEDSDLTRRFRRLYQDSF